MSLLIPLNTYMAVEDHILMPRSYLMFNWPELHHFIQSAVKVKVTSALCFIYNIHIGSVFYGNNPVGTEPLCSAI